MTRFHHDIFNTTITYDIKKIQSALNTEGYTYSTINDQIIFYCRKESCNSSNLVRLAQYKFSCDRPLYDLTSADPIDVKEFYIHSRFRSVLRFNSPFCKFNKDFIEYLVTGNYYNRPYFLFTLNFQNNSINLVTIPKNTSLGSYYSYQKKNDTFCYSSEYVYIIDFMYGNHIKLPMLPFSQIKESRSKNKYIIKVANHLANLNNSYLASILWWNGRRTYIFDIYQVSNNSINLIHSVRLVLHYRILGIGCTSIGDRLIVAIWYPQDLGHFFILSTEEGDKVTLLNKDYMIFGTPVFSRWDDAFEIKEKKVKNNNPKIHLVYNNKIFDDTILKRVKDSARESDLVVW